jgi:hypothetical protein
MIARIGLAATLACTLAAPAGAQPVDPSARPPLLTVPNEPEPRPEPRRWDGNHTGLLVAATGSQLDGAPIGVTPRGYGLRVAGRLAFIAQVAEFEAGYEHMAHGSATGGGGGWQRDELSAQGAFHPIFPAAVFSSFLGDVLAGFHGFLGASIVRGTAQGAATVAALGGSGASLAEWQPSVFSGAGLDVPITRGNADWGLWLVGRWTLRWLSFGPQRPRPDLGDTQAMVGLNVRWYTTNWARMPRPF